MSRKFICLILGIVYVGFQSVVASPSASPNTEPAVQSGDEYIASDCNYNGVLDVNESGSSGSGVVYAVVGIPEDIIQSPFFSDYPLGFLVTDAETSSVVHVAPHGGRMTVFATGFSQPMGMIMAPDEFGGVGDRLFVADPVRGELLFVAADGEVELFADLSHGYINGVTYIPERVSGGNLLVTSYRHGAERGSIRLIDEFGIITTLHSGIDAWSPALAPYDFGQYGNHVFFGSVFGSYLYALDLVENELKLFASVPLPSGQDSGLRHIAFSPVGWATFLDPALANESVLLASVTSSGSSQGERGFVSVWDQRGKMLAALYKGADELMFEPRGLLFVENDLLISDISDEHGWLVRTTVEDFGFPDCDGDGILDECEIFAGSLDCNSNAVPDECEVDCNRNGVPDQCDFIDGTITDCDGNFVPDVCEQPDCGGGGGRVILNRAKKLDADYLPVDRIFNGDLPSV